MTPNAETQPQTSGSAKTRRYLVTAFLAVIACQPNGSPGSSATSESESSATAKSSAPVTGGALSESGSPGNIVTQPPVEQMMAAFESECGFSGKDSKKLEADKEVTNLISRLKTGSEEERKAAAAALGAKGEKAYDAVAPLLESLQGQNVIQVAFDGTYPNAVAAAIARILGRRSPYVALAMMTATGQESALKLVWGSVIAKSGDAAVPCIVRALDIAEPPKAKVLLLGLKMMNTEGLLVKAKPQALAAIQRLKVHSDADIQSIAKELEPALGR